jgi:hypothetical protein
VKKTFMADIPMFDGALRQALRRVNSDDVRIFYEYFDGLKRQVRRREGLRNEEPAHVRGDASA